MTRRHATIIRLASALCLVSASSLTACQNDQGGSSTDAQAQRDAGPAAEGDGADGGTPSKADDAQADGAAAEGAAADEAAADSEGAEAETGEGETGGGEPGEVAVIAAPEGYGVFQFEEPAPTEADLPLYGLAGYEVVAIYAKPDKESEKYGFLRIGTRMRVGPAIKNEDCPSGWHQLATGGYACSSRGLVVDKRDPYLAYKPSQVDLAQPFPYKWAYVRKWNTPQWWRAPTAEEYAATAEKQAILESERTGVPLPSEAPAGGGSGGGDGAGAGAGDGEGGDESAVEGDGAAAPEPAPEPPPPPPQEEPEEEKPPVKIPMSPSSPWL
ncbi:MAG: hypothetical protein KC431_22540, partial [Myxococcales bacterium]|nr:hypothetical protein [Myxococcales bacterium]